MMGLQHRPAAARTLGAILLLASGLGACTTTASSGPGIPTTRVERGDVVADLYTSGEFTARRNQLISAPAVPGSLRLVHLVPTGTAVKAGEVIMRFDPAEQLFNLEQAESQVAEAEQELAKQDADRAVQAAQDEVNLLKARFEVRKAELDVTTNELLAEVDARKNQLTLEEARRKSAQLEEDVKSRGETNKAAVAVLQEKRQKAALARETARRAIEQMEVHAPFDGIVAVRQNQDAGGGFFFQGMTLPDFREGDVVFPGRPVLSILDPAELQLRARVAEALATGVTTGQAAEVELDGSARPPLQAKVLSVSGMADRGGIFRAPTAQREFDVALQLAGEVTEVEPGRSARIRISGAPLTGVLSIPRQAVFDRNGAPTVFVQQDGRFVPTPLAIVARTQTRVVVDTLEEGTVVALANPEATTEPAKSAAAGPAAAAGGPAR
jgi:HlyD family secretion protein